MKNTLLVRSLIIMIMLAIAVILSLLATGCAQNTAYLSPSTARNVAESRPNFHQINDLTELAADQEKEPFETALMPEQVEGCATNMGGDYTSLTGLCDPGECFNNFLAESPSP